ncbi:MAG TPA: SpoIID/LytB domain-containing protein [Candidatus Solibacter sp.]|nr:SpoIID/LytB domain-containing protein [Candidatus Solibacter sp.]
MPATSALADPTPDQLAALKAQEQSQRAALNQLAGQQQSAQAMLDQLRADFNAKQADYQSQLARADQLSRQIAALDARGQQIQRQHDAHINLFRTQSRSLYKTGPADAIVFLFEANSFSDFLDRLIYIAHVTRDNYDQAVRLREERDALSRDRDETARLKAELDPLLAELAARAAAASGQVQNQAAIESQIEAQQRAQLAALRGTQRAETQLEQALAAAAAAAAAAGQKGSGLAYGSVCPAAPAGKISFCGHGWGHGVGLAQYGALGMAQAGIGWQQIIHSFYSGVSIGSVPDQTVRVYLTGAGGAITPRSAPATVQDVSGNVLGHLAQDQTATFSRNGDGSISASWAGGSAHSSTLRLVPGLYFQVSGSGREYRGEAWVDGSSGFKVINHVELESYLQGIAEVPSSWPLNALAAQMVAARTYALYHLGGGLYDVDDTTASQVYGGVGRETQSQNAAIATTHLQGVFYGGQIIDAVFSSSDGGHTQSAVDEWGGSNTPYLAGVVDNYDVSPLHTWYTPAHTLSEIQGYLGGTYSAAQCGTLRSFDLSDRDASDRLNSVRMVGSSRVCTVTPGAFIRAINAGSPADFVVYGEMFGTSPGNRAWRYW